MVDNRCWMPPPRQFQPMFNDFQGPIPNTHNAKIQRSMYTCVRPPSRTILRDLLPPEYRNRKSQSLESTGEKQKTKSLWRAPVAARGGRATSPPP